MQYKLKIQWMRSLLMACFLIGGCSANTEPTPIEKSEVDEQLALAFKVTKLTKEYLYSEHVSYDYSFLCNGKMESGDSAPINSLQNNIVPSSLTDKIKKLSSTKQVCDGKPTELVRFLGTVAEYVDKYDSTLTIFIQFPWKNIDENTAKELTKAVNKIKIKNYHKINKIVLFGLNGDSKKNVEAFQSFRDKNVSGGLDFAATQQNFTNIASKTNILKPKNSLIFFFAPINAQ
jgi:hypothetical protein